MTSIDIPESVTSIGYGAFYDCTSLTSITLPEGVTSIGNRAFEGCRSLTSIVVAEGNKVYDSRGGCNAIIETSSNTLIQGCSTTIIPESVTSIGEEAFYKCTSLTSITIPESVTSIGAYAFDGCSSLTSITIPESVTSIGYSVFSGCRSLTSITLPEGVTSIGSYAFCDCSSLTAIVLPKSVRSINSVAFGRCSELTDVYCHAEKVPSTETDAFNGSYIENVTLHVPASAVSEYKNTAPWSGFGKFETTSIAVASITLSASSATLTEGESLTLTITLLPDDATNKSVSWSSSNPSIATVDNAGKVTAIAPGTATITATANDGSEVNASCEVMVMRKEIPVTGIELNRTSATLTEGATLALTATVTPSDADDTSVTWSSSNDGVATVDNTGKVTAIAPGTVTITATAKDGSGVSTSCKVTVVKKEIPVTGIELNRISATLTEGATLALTATVTPGDADDTSVTWSSSDPNVATVDNNGKVTAIAPGTATITATANDASGVSASCKVTVSSASYVITYLVDGEVYATEALSHGATIVAPDAPTKEGHTFSGWSGLPETMPAKDITVSATFTVNKYKVTFIIDGVVIANYTQDYGTPIVPPTMPEREGYTFSGWGNVAQTVPASDVTYEGSYSVNSYTITYFVDGEVAHSESVTYGSSIIALDAPTKEGHTFSGWSGLPETMPAHDVTVSGTFSINKYLVTFMVDGVVIASESLEYGSEITIPSVPDREGYTFNGWSDVAETVPAHDIIYHGSYAPNLYKVYYFVGATLVHITEVAYGEPIPEYVYEPTEEGYTFLGWVGEVYNAMPAHDVSYTASIINAIEQLTIGNAELIYDLYGRRMTDTKSLRSGIYIINGRKTFIK